MNRRIALAVGIDYYDRYNVLSQCVDDACAVRDLLEYNGDAQRSRNFDCELLAGTRDEKVLRSQLADAIEELFSKPSEIALFYYSGHGAIQGDKGYIMASDCDRGDEGFPLDQLVDQANKSPATHRVIIIDSCFSGFAGMHPVLGDYGLISSGVTVLTACRSNEVAYEGERYGVFTSLFLDALEGGAASLTGEITPGAIYAHIDQSLGSWEQRPVFKTCTDSFASIRKVEPPVSIEELRCLPSYFPEADSVFPLDPSYEPRNEGRTADMPVADGSNVAIFRVLQQFNRLNLVVPVDADHMWNAAMESKGCKLTKLGKHYRRLAANKVL